MTRNFRPTVLHRDVLRLTGADVPSFLNGILTIGTLALPPLSYGALLTPQGKILETMFLWSLDGAVLIDVPAGRGEALLKRLSFYKLRAAVDITDHGGAMGVGASAAEDGVPQSALARAPDPRAAGLGVRWLAPAGEGLESEPQAYGDHLINQGVPDLGAGIESAAVFPLDVNLDALGGIDHKKGCFVGQEVASRMFRKGQVRKRTWRVRAEEGTIAPALPLTADGSTLGEITAVATDGRTGLAIVRQDRLEAAGDEAIEAEGTPVTLGAPDYLA